MVNKYMKTTGGQSAQVFVAKATAYTDDADFKTFVGLGADGEMGVFLVYDSSATTTYTEANAIANASDAAIQAADKFFIAQIQVHVGPDGVTRRLIHRTPVYTYNEMNVRTQAYVAPVKQVTNIGYGSLSTTTGSMNSGTLINGQIFPIKLIETTPQNQPFPTWNYEEVSKQGDTIIKIGARLLKQMNDTTYAQNIANNRLVRAELLSDGTFVASSGGSFTVVQDSNVITVPESAGAAADAGKYAADASSMAVGDYLRIGGTTAASPIYKIAAVSGIGTSLATITLDSPYQGASGTVTAANTLVNTVAPTEIGFKLTSFDFDTHFRIALDEDIASADLVYTTPYKEGIGYYPQVAQQELEGQVYAGYTTLNNAFTSDFGQPGNYAVSGTTYQYIFLDYVRTKPSVAAPKVSDTHYGHVMLVLPVGVAPTSDLDGMFV